MDPAPEAPDEIRCSECGTRIAEGQDRQETDSAVFCRPCFERLTLEVERALARQGEGINYPMALVGGIVGGGLGVALWWGFTVVTKIAFGLVAVVIGFGVGKGVTILSGHKRHRNLQILSVALSVAGFAYATYLVNRTFLLRAFAAEGQSLVLPWLPDPQLFYHVVAASFGIMDVIFLGIVIFQAWKIPAPFRLGPRA